MELQPPLVVTNSVRLPSRLFDIVRLTRLCCSVNTVLVGEQSVVRSLWFGQGYLEDIVSDREVFWMTFGSLAKE